MATIRPAHIQALTGRVVSLSPIAIVQQGDTTFTVTIELDKTNLPPRWGMTAKVKILIECERMMSRAQATAAYRSNSLAMTKRWIWLVPS